MAPLMSSSRLHAGGPAPSAWASCRRPPVMQQSCRQRCWRLCRPWTAMAGTGQRRPAARPQLSLRQCGELPHALNVFATRLP